MLNKIFGLNNNSETSIIIQLNDKIMPVDRGDYYEDPLEEYLNLNNYGEIIGSGTMQEQSGEITFCDIEIQLYKGVYHNRIIDDLALYLETLGAPKGSHITIDNSNELRYFGKKEGLAIYLDGVNLPENVYTECDINVVIEELSKLVRYEGEFQRYWEGSTETALYFYGDSFEDMKTAILEFTNIYPLCQNARIIQIA